jgi:hypothetical protein
VTLAELSDASQAVAAVAVVASLIIIILQNHQANILAREEAMRRQIEGLQTLSRVLFETPGMADIWERGTSDFDSLPNQERIRFLSFVAYTCRIWEALHRQHLRGQLDDDLWRSHVQMLRDVQGLEGHKRAWALRKHVFSEAFQTFYEANATQGVPRDLYGLDLAEDAQSPSTQT